MCHVFVKKGAPNTNYIGALKNHSSQATPNANDFDSAVVC